ncbi:CPBP family intramembrane glutamic endopeptidase [Lusitaniella coriacea]|uniref:CPBP family intramembrane glutamic endopeptidase n=1 Tax=Lusitaniella coriacea TaxID=1983105 RepID=UPI003CEC0DC1
MHQDNPFLTIQFRTLILWVILSILALSAIAIALSIFWGIVSLFGNPDNPIATFTEPDPIVPLVFLNVGFYGLIVLWCLEQKQQSHLNFHRVWGKLPQNRKWLRLLLLVFPILLFSLGSGQIFLSLFMPILPDAMKSSLESPLFLSEAETSVPLLYNLLVLIFVIGVAPIVEEVLFRGILCQRWATTWGLSAGIIVSSLVFGILHPVNPIGLFIFGLMMAILYVKTRTLTIPILVHALNNAIAIVLTSLSVSPETTNATTTVEQFFSAEWMGLICVAVSIPWLLIYAYQNWPTKSTSLPYWANK